MTKEETIKKAWGIAYEEVRSMLTENGYIPSIDLAHSNLELSIYNIQLTYNNIGVRPVTLKGIEHNNGWIKIESEDDLPTEYIECYFLFRKTIRQGFFDENSKCFYDRYNLGLKEITHYQPIEKPKPPIY